MSITMKKKYSVISLGCKVNQYEIKRIAQKLNNHGLCSADNKDADISIINTCAVTKTSDKKSRQIIRRIKKENPDTFLIVTGCYSESVSDIKANLSEIDMVVSNKDKEDIPDIVIKTDNRILSPNFNRESYIKDISFTDRVRQPLKIVDGCNAFCSYCAIPYLRGSKIVSKSPSNIIKEFDELITNGTAEIIITGVNLGKYGEDLRSVDLPSLLIKLVSLKSYQNSKIRIRLSSIEIGDIDDKLIELIKDKKICNHLHIPLQSGSGKILKLMNRSYNSKDFTDKIKAIKKEIPDINLTTDIIVGFPGESESDFNKTVKLCKSTGFSKVHIFPYSPRQNTQAMKLKKHINSETKQNRCKNLRMISKKIMLDKMFDLKGKVVEVLPESVNSINDTSMLSGFTRDYFRVYFKGESKLIGKLLNVRINECKNSCLFGEIVQLVVS